MMLKLRLDLEEAKLSIEVGIKQAINLYERKGNYSVPYLRSIIQIAKEDLEKEFNYPVSEYSDWYIVKCKMTEEEARQSEMEQRVFQIAKNRKIIELFTKELKSRNELAMNEVYTHMEHRKNSLKKRKNKSMNMTYKEQLNEFKNQDRLNHIDIAVAIEVEMYFENVSDNDFESICDYLKRIYLKYENAEISQLTYCFASLFGNGKSINEILEINSSSFMNEAYSI